MANQESAIVFDQERASSYDKRFSKLAPLRETLHLLISTVFSNLPDTARILCVGAGTGLELAYLAQKFSHWTFTAVEPSAAMLDICRSRAHDCGYASRCVFHEGYLDSLPDSGSFHAATSLLVSHFILSLEARTDFFRQIAERLLPNGYLASADLASDMSSTAYKELLQVWLRLLEEAGLPAEEIESFRVSYGRDVGILPPQEVAAIISSGGFTNPVLFLQTGLIHAWYAKRT